MNDTALTDLCSHINNTEYEIISIYLFVETDI
jgi:hypothetical protein